MHARSKYDTSRSDVTPVYVRNRITSGVYIMPKKNNAVEVGKELQFEAVVTKADGKSD
ncbi:MAG: hypothetical protein LBP35_06240 [Candidatus Ancillula trichonymphae]|nr:hypothetical protein [Candidatus Ancillula trichonymphae]